VQEDILVSLDSFIAKCHIMSRRRFRTAQQTFFAVSKSFKAKQNWISRELIVAAEICFVSPGSSTEKHTGIMHPFLVDFRNDQNPMSNAVAHLRNIETISWILAVFWCGEERCLDHIQKFIQNFRTINEKVAGAMLNT
jgi:hypothetical protein